jgi:hypothetical protein
LRDLLTIGQTKVFCLEAEKVKLDQKLIGLWFNMDDCRVVTIEV